MNGSSSRRSAQQRWCSRFLAFAVVIYLVQQQFGLAIVRMDNIVSPVDISDVPQLSAVVSNITSSTSAPTTNSSTSSETVFFDPETAFQISAYNSILRLINNDSIISWGYKKAKGFPEELRLKSVLTPGLDIVRLHELSTEGKRAVWSNTTHSPFLWESRICDAIQEFRQTQQMKPHVLFTRCNENFGEFSRYVGEHKTTNWDDHVEWSSNGCASDDEVWEYLNHSHARAVFTTQHHFVDHPKVHSLPIGIKYTMKAQILKLLREPRENKTNLLMINDNGWKHRKQMTALVMENFAKHNITLTNTYNKRKSSGYLKDLRRSKFILAPSGLGWDCYRIWEALHFNTIPIIERYHRPHDGWRRTLEGLPVLWVEDFSEVTPVLLRTEYQRIAAKGSEYQFEKLTRDWWIRFIQSQLLLRT